MFITDNIPCGIKSVTLKIEEADGTEQRVAHATCTLEPFVPSLAHELGEDIYDHVFTRDPEHPGVPMPRREIADVGFVIRCGLQRITARSHPDLPPDGDLRNVRISRVRVTRPDLEKPRLAMSFVVSIALDDRETTDWLVRAFARVNYLSFQPEQRRMAYMSDAEADALSGAIHAREAAEDFVASVPADTSMSITAAGKTVHITPEDAKRVRERRDRAARKARR